MVREGGHCVEAVVPQMIETPRQATHQLIEAAQKISPDIVTAHEEIDDRRIVPGPCSV